MIEIIPNWHPVFVHFTVALLSVAVGMTLLARLVRDSRLRQQWIVVARWNLWIGTAAAVATAFSGWLAFNSVAHDGPSHLAMLEHRNWALVTLAWFLALMAWSLWSLRRDTRAGKLFIILMLIGGGLLAATAWHGAELVFRHGLGVMSLPQAEVPSQGAGLDEAQTDPAALDAPVSGMEEETSPVPPSAPASGHDHSGHSH